VRPAVICCVLIGIGFLVACGSSRSTPTPSVLTGNWAITLNRHATTDPQTFSGFLIQSGNAITGSVILGDGCSGIGPVTGTVDGQSLNMTINESGQDLSLAGTVPTSNGNISGAFSTIPGGCTAFPNTGTWTARLIPPLNGTFHGTLTSATNGTINITGTLAQGLNTGASTAALNGTVTTENPQQFCNYLTTATISGLISGTQVTLDIFGPNGVQITQINASTTPDATSVTGAYVFPRISSSCFGDQGVLQITFP
jgi:hypothetical protein